MGRLQKLSRKAPVILTKEITNLVREDCFIIEDALCPVHQRVHILGCRKLCGAFEFDPIFPKILVSAGHEIRLGRRRLQAHRPRTSGHDGALAISERSAPAWSGKAFNALLEGCRTR